MKTVRATRHPALSLGIYDLRWAIYDGPARRVKSSVDLKFARHYKVDVTGLNQLLQRHNFMSRKIRYGMVGGGRGAFIGAVHRIAAALDQQIELVCGAFSSDPERSRASGADFFLAPGRDRKSVV